MREYLYVVLQNKNRNKILRSHTFLLKILKVLFGLKNCEVSVNIFLS